MSDMMMQAGVDPWAEVERQARRAHAAEQERDEGRVLLRGLLDELAVAKRELEQLRREADRLTGNWSDRADEEPMEPVRRAWRIAASDLSAVLAAKPQPPVLSAGNIIMLDDSRLPWQIKGWRHADTAGLPYVHLMLGVPDQEVDDGNQ